MKAKDTRNISCVRIKMRDAIRATLEEAEPIGECPLPSEQPIIPLEEYITTVNFLLSLDYGLSVLKLMIKFIRNKPSQNTNEVTLLVRATRTCESFEYINASMGQVCGEIYSCKTISFVVGKKKSNCKSFFVGDFYVFFSIFGFLRSFLDISFPLVHSTKHNT